MKRPAHTPTHTILLSGFMAAGLALSGWMAIAASHGLTHTPLANSSLSSATENSYLSPDSISFVSNQSTYIAPTVGQPLRTEGGGTR
ncbi:MAG: hypothetical protein WBA57_26885 [Elainellaceae cyanobacterium]